MVRSQLDFAGQYEQFEKFQVTDYFRAVTTTVLVPLAEPEEGHDFVRGEATLGEQSHIVGRRFNIVLHQMFFRMDLRIHCFFLPPIAG